jgi:hypothetical protein
MPSKGQTLTGLNLSGRLRQLVALASAGGES